MKKVLVVALGLIIAGLLGKCVGSIIGQMQSGGTTDTKNFYSEDITKEETTEKLPEVDVESYVDTTGSKTESHVDTNNSKTENVYLLSALPGSLKISEKYNVYSLDNPFTEDMCKSQGVEYDNMNLYLEFSGFDMVICPKEDLLSNPSFVIEVRVKSDKDYGINNSKDLSDEDFSIWAYALSSGFGAGDTYTVVETDKAKFVVFDWEGYNQRRYATIMNGKMVYIIGESTNKDVLASIDTDLKSIAESLKLDV